MLNPTNDGLKVHRGQFSGSWWGNADLLYREYKIAVAIAARFRTMQLVALDAIKPYLC